MWVSPFTRTRQIAISLLKGGLDAWITDCKESVQLIEQDWGLFEGAGWKRKDGEGDYLRPWRTRLSTLKDHFKVKCPQEHVCEKIKINKTMKQKASYSTEASLSRISSFRCQKCNWGMQR
eukprot:UN30501